jgi:hypothetical protein
VQRRVRRAGSYLARCEVLNFILEAKVNFLFGLFIFVGCFQSFLVEAKESDAGAIEASLNSAGRDYLQFFITDSQEILNDLQRSKDFRLEYEKKKGRVYEHQRGIQLRDLYRLLRAALLHEEENGLGNDLSVKFILEMRKSTLEILRTRYLSAGEGVHLICDIFDLLEELPDKRLPRNYFLLEAADAIRKNADPLMDLKAKDLILSEFLFNSQLTGEGRRASGIYLVFWISWIAN